MNSLVGMLFINTIDSGAGNVMYVNVTWTYKTYEIIIQSQQNIKLDRGKLNTTILISPMVSQLYNSSLLLCLYMTGKFKILT
jgi:hypothetical protein